jgi:GT2 family glycosyltransferase
MPVMLVHPLIEQFTRDAIRAVQKNTLSPWEMTIVVHGGESFDIESPNVTVKTMQERLSIARAYNWGFEDMWGDYFCCLHNDTHVMPEWDLHMMAEASAGNIAFPIVDESGGFCELRGITPRENWLPSSCCFMLTRELWHQLGGYDERYEGMHFEDTDLFHRARELGARLVECPPATVLHYRGVTRCLLPDKGFKEFADNQQRWWLKYREEESKELLHNPRLEGY